MEKAIKRYWPVFVLPTLIAFIIGFVWPFIWGTGLSFCKFTTVKNVQFVGGCNGNLKGIGALVEGMDVQDVIARVEGIRCGMKSTSCPDQLAKALKEAVAAQA